MFKKFQIKLIKIINTNKYRPCKIFLHQSKNFNELNSSQKLSSHFNYRSINFFFKSISKLLFRFGIDIFFSALIRKFLLSTDLNGLTLKNFWKNFNDQSEFFVSFNNFQSFCKSLGLNYCMKRESFDNSNESKSKRISFLTLLNNEYSNIDQEVYYFDVSSFSETSLKKKNWNLRDYPTTFKKKFSYNLTHFLFCINNEGNFYAQFIKGNINSNIIFEFLNHFQKDFRKQNNIQKLTIVLDNSSLHKTAQIKEFCIEKEIKMIFFPPKNPFFNPAEFAFRYLKGNLRTHTKLF